MSTQTEEVKPSDLQKAAMDLASDSKSSSEGQTTIWPERELPELLRDLSEEELKSLEKKLIRKVDLRMLPTMILIYIMNYLDRSASCLRRIT